MVHQGAVIRPRAARKRTGANNSFANAYWGNEMISLIQNLRIGTKLAITSGLAILMVAGMLYMQVTGGAHVRQTTATAARQQTIAMTAAEAKASVRGMQVGLRDVLLAHSDADLQQASRYFADRVAAALRFQGEMAKLAKSV